MLSKTSCSVDLSFCSTITIHTLFTSPNSILGSTFYGTGTVWLKHPFPVKQQNKLFLLYSTDYIYILASAIQVLILLIIHMFRMTYHAIFCYLQMLLSMLQVLQVHCVFRQCNLVVIIICI